MELGELFIGRRVRVYDWIGHSEDRPEHWNDAGEMDAYCGKVVTIDYIDEVEVYIREDGNEFYWLAEDFDPYDDLSANDPNTRFKSAKLIEQSKWSAAEIRKFLIDNLSSRR